MEGLAAIVEAVLAGRGVHGHAADGIANGCGGVGVMIVMAVLAWSWPAWPSPPQQRAVSVGAFILVHHPLRRL